MTGSRRTARPSLTSLKRIYDNCLELVNMDDIEIPAESAGIVLPELEPRLKEEFFKYKSSADTFHRKALLYKESLVSHGSMTEAIQVDYETSVVQRKIAKFRETYGDILSDTSTWVH